MKNNKLNIDRIAFIGRTFAEYINMFNLDEDMLRQGPNIWDYYKNKNEVIALRNKPLELFKNDSPHGLAGGRYRKAELP